MPELVHYCRRRLLPPDSKSPDGSGVRCSRLERRAANIQNEGQMKDVWVTERPHFESQQRQAASSAIAAVDPNVVALGTDEACLALV